MTDNGSLREKVYHYLRETLADGSLTPGSYIDQNLICDNLEISRAPLRDALIQLESEGFVEILPRRGVLIKKLTLQDIKNFYEIIGCLESSVILSEFHKFRPADITALEEINARLREKLDKNCFDRYYELNLAFHGVFLKLSDNALLNHIISPLKQRLYDFPLMEYDREWEAVNLSEHQRFIDSIKAGNREAAASIFRYEHWSFERHRENLTKIYRLG
ncbi:MAG: GntR family transcriptional regulator [Deltaproteobacteria bacterium]|nr:MAG: GntR family transcriptional regulator [Deltaproteobacteria bacterium]